MKTLESMADPLFRQAAAAGPSPQAHRFDADSGLPRSRTCAPGHRLNPAIFGKLNHEVFGKSLAVNPPDLLESTRLSVFVGPCPFFRPVAVAIRGRGYRIGTYGRRPAGCVVQSFQSGPSPVPAITAAVANIAYTLAPHRGVARLAVMVARPRHSGTSCTNRDRTSSRIRSNVPNVTPPLPFTDRPSAGSRQFRFRRDSVPRDLGPGETGLSRADGDGRYHRNSPSVFPLVVC